MVLWVSKKHYTILMIHDYTRIRNVQENLRYQFRFRIEIYVQTYVSKLLKRKICKFTLQN